MCLNHSLRFRRWHCHEFQVSSNEVVFFYPSEFNLRWLRHWVFVKIISQLELDSWTIGAIEYNIIDIKQYFEKNASKLSQIYSIKTFLIFSTNNKIYRSYTLNCAWIGFYFLLEFYGKYLFLFIRIFRIQNIDYSVVHFRKQLQIIHLNITQQRIIIISLTALILAFKILHALW